MRESIIVVKAVNPRVIVQTGDIVDKRSETSLTLFRIRHEGEHLPCHGKRVQQWKNENGSSRKQKQVAQP